MAGGQSQAIMRAKTKEHQQRAGKKKPQKDSFLSSPRVGPVVLGFLVFVIVGSLLLQIVRNASGGKAIGV